MRIKLFCVTLLCSLCLCGCTYDADRIYTVCKYGNGETIVYNENGFYSYDVSSQKVTPVASVGLKKSPAMFIRISSGDFDMTEDLPGKFTSTKENLEHYLYALVVDGYIPHALSADGNSITMEMTSEERTIKVYYFRDDSLRMYASDYDVNQNSLPYINEEK